MWVWVCVCVWVGVGVCGGGVYLVHCTPRSGSPPKCLQGRGGEALVRLA